MLAGLPQEEKEKYSLKKAEDYAYLNQVMTPCGYGVTEKRIYCVYKSESDVFFLPCLGKELCDSGQE
jgi:hypothetical protein